MYDYDVFPLLAWYCEVIRYELPGQTNIVYSNGTATAQQINFFRL